MDGRGQEVNYPLMQKAAELVELLSTKDITPNN